MHGKELLALVGEISYDGGVTDAELWAAVGVRLKALRLEKGYTSTIAFATAVGTAGQQKTFDRIEVGRPGRVSMVEAYCRGVGTDLTSILRRLLPAERVSARAQQVAEAYDRTPSARELVDVALGLARTTPTLGRQQDQPADAPPATAAGNRARVRTGRGRR